MKNMLISAALFVLLALPILAQSSQNNKVLKVGIESDIDILGPWESGFMVNDKILYNIFETLVALEERSTKIKPMLATSWEVSDNNRTWTFKLRKGVKFHDGSYLTADDVLASSSLFQDLGAKTEKVDRLTVRFILTEPNSGFLHKLVDVKYAIAPSGTVGQYIALYKKTEDKEFIPIGSGPFKFIRREKGKRIILQSFKDYWQGTPWLNKLIYRVIPDNKTRLSYLEKGDIDIIDVIFPKDMPRIRRNPNLSIISIYGLDLCFIAMNTDHKPLGNIKVRKALNLALDKMRLSRMFYYGGYGVPTNRILSPAFWGFSLLSPAGSYQPKAAKRMLTEAGYDKGLSLELLCIPMARPYLPNPKGMTKEIKKQFANIGVDVYINIPTTYSKYHSIINKGDYDLVLAGWIDVTGDPDYTLHSLLGDKLYVFNYSRWQNKLFNAKLKAARELPLSDVKSRIRLYNEAQKIFQDELPLIPLFHTKIVIIYNRKVKGIILYPSSIISYHKVKFSD